MNEKTLAFLGILRKGGNLIIGKAAESAIEKASLVLVSEDAGEAVKKSFADKASYHHKRLVFIGSKEQLGQALGYQEISAVAILHPKAAKKVLQLEGITPQKGEL